MDYHAYQRGLALRRLIVYALGGYLAITAFVGYQYGTHIHEARTNPFVNAAAVLAGRDATEELAMQIRPVPDWVRASPAFWLTLRLTE